MAIINSTRMQRLESAHAFGLWLPGVGLFMAAMMVALLPGCGGPKVATVGGKVTVGGQPATRGTITFMPDQSKGTVGKIAVGKIGLDGSYSLGTSKKKNDTIVGYYRVVISGRGLDDPENALPDHRIRAIYGNPTQSGLIAEVKPGCNTIDFQLTP